MPGRGRAATAGGAVSLEVTARGIVIPAEELFWRFSRSAGPGGQSVNTSDSRAELSFNVAQSAVLPPALKQRALRALRASLADGVITVTAAENRSQLRNREAAAARLSALLADGDRAAAPAAAADPADPGLPRAPPGGQAARSQTKRLRRSPGRLSALRPRGAARPDAPPGFRRRGRASTLGRCLLPARQARRDRPVLSDRDRRRRELSQNYLRSAGAARSSCGDVDRPTRPGCAWRSARARAS